MRDPGKGSVSALPGRVGKMESVKRVEREHIADGVWLIAHDSLWRIAYSRTKMQRLWNLLIVLYRYMLSAIRSSLFSCHKPSAISSFLLAPCWNSRT